AVFGFPRAEHYAATKMGVIGITRCIAVEYARNNIRANAVIPGWIQTDMTQPLIDHPKFVEKNLKRIPMRRWGQPSDLAPMAVYFASDESNYHTGDVITVDGGYCRY
ncbi:MAG: SDR family NAD(P)-dependent oxidoreductase, partial [Candidatus Hodarchaeales archaeon]